MSKNLLVVDNLDFSIKFIEDLNITHILALGIEKEEITKYLNFQLKSNFPIEIIDSNLYRREAEMTVRRYIIDTVSDLSKYKNRSKHLSKLIPNKNGLSIWWYLEISEKSPFRGIYINLLYQLGIFQLLKSSSIFTNVYFDIKEIRLLKVIKKNELNFKEVLLFTFTNYICRLNEVKYFFYLTQFFLQIELVKIISKLLGSKKLKTLESHAIFSFYPNWWINSYNEDHRDRFFPNLVNLDDKYVNYIWLNEKIIDVLGLVKKIRWLTKKSENTIIQNFFLFKEYKKLVGVRSWRSLRNFRKEILNADIPEFMDLDVRTLLSEEISRCISSRDLLQTQVIGIAMINLLKSLRPKSLVFRIEFQPLDKALIHSSKGLTKSVGFYHSSLAMSENYLSFWFGKNFIDKNFASIYPDVIIYPNNFTESALNREGFPESRRHRCGPLRSSEVIQYASSKKEKHNKEILTGKKFIKIFVGFSVNKEANMIMFRNILSVLSSDSSYTIYLKNHPSLDTFDLSLLSSQSNIEIISVDRDIEFYSILSSCDFSIFTGTSLVFESILLNTFPIVYESVAIFNGINFSEFNKFCLVTYDVNQLRIAVNNIMRNSEEIKFIESNWAEFIEINFGKSTSLLDRKNLSNYLMHS